ncbi:MAG: TonB-dependent receptor family protein [Terriglobales bacterium]
MPIQRNIFFGVLILTILLSTGAFADITISGVIRDVQDQPLNHVVVSAPEQDLRTYTDEQGKFSLQLKSPVERIILVFDSPCCYSQSTTFELKTTTTLDVALTPRKMVKSDIDVIASRLDIPLEVNPAATTIVVPETLAMMPRGVNAAEALESVPSVKSDNQANQQRVHVSIRGQGILSEHGLRGIEVLLDGIPLSDPTGFVPDLFDVDWDQVQEVQVVRGPVAVLYGGGSAAGVIDLRTHTPEETTHGTLWANGGSNAYYKTRGEISGTAKGIGYNLNFARSAGDGYRVHTQYWGNILSGRVYFKLSPSFKMSVFGIGTGYWNQNPEGLNIDQVRQDPRQPNPDSLKFNEYQETKRFTGGFTGRWTRSDNQELAFNFFARPWNYTESVPSSVMHRSLRPLEGSTQYNINSRGMIKNFLGIGVDAGGQSVDAWAYPNLGNAVEGSGLLADDSITQSHVGIYAMDRLNPTDRWTLFFSGRWDRIGQSLTDRLKLNGLDLSGSQSFNRATGRVGATYSINENLSAFASWGSGFLPPATEELLANPDAIGGFNKHLQPATSNGPDVGMRGNVGYRFYYDLTFFYLSTHNDFERYRLTDRPLETFYANGGHSNRYGLEAAARWLPTRWLTVAGAYTLSHFTYSDYVSHTYAGDLNGNYLPNSPGNQLYVDALVQLPRKFSVSVKSMSFSKAYIDPTNSTWIDGYTLLGARIGKDCQYKNVWVRLFVAAANLTNTRYIAFTEPDPDGNSYQPGPGREVFGGMEFRF